MEEKSDKTFSKMKSFEIVIENGQLFDGRTFTLYKCLKSGVYDIQYKADDKNENNQRRNT